MKIIKAKDRLTLENKLPQMPWFVGKFINYKLPDLSPSSLLEYVRDYEALFSRLLGEGLSNAVSFKDIFLEDLEKHLIRYSSVSN
nr:hypothetical protein [Paenibacillus psychroresistens]